MVRKYNSLVPLGIKGYRMVTVRDPKLIIFSISKKIFYGEPQFVVIAE